MENAIAILAVILISLMLIISPANAPFGITCEAGGPYSKNATINVIGNLTNTSGFVGTVSVNISKGGAQYALTQTPSDSDGAYAASFLPNLDFDTYTAATNASSNGSSVYCTDTFTVQLGVNTSCIIKRINVEGTAIYSSTGRLVTAANITAAVVEESIVNTSRINGTGGFKVPLTGCMFVGTRYTVSVLIQDDAGLRSQAEQLFVFS